MTPGLVSVVTPCHNAEAFVAETIESVLAQTYSSVEHLVVDDGSSDASWRVIQSYVERYPDRIRALRLETSRGGCHARNRGAELAAGEFLMFLDADDLISPGTVDALVQAVQREGGAVAFAPWSRLRQHGAGGEWVVGPAEVPLPPPEADAALRGWIEGRAWAPPCAVLWPRDTYDRTEGWDEEVLLNQDGDLMMRALAAGVRPVRALRGQALYRTFGAARRSVSQSFVEEGRLRSRIGVLDRIRRELERQGRMADFRSALARGYQVAALRAFESGHWELGRESFRQGMALDGRKIVSPKRLGRILERGLGLERKERLVQAIGSLGVMTTQRRRVERLRKLEPEATRTRGREP